MEQTARNVQNAFVKERIWRTAKKNRQHWHKERSHAWQTKNNSYCFELTFWKRYINDILKRVKSGHTWELTDLLNSIDNNRNIEFTHEEETNKYIAFLDMKIHHKKDSSIKLKIYTKPTHMDQNFLWTSEHPFADNLSIVRTLLRLHQHHNWWRR